MFFKEGFTMFPLCLLLALTVSYSIYAADTEIEVFVPTHNAAQMIPGTIPLPDDLVAIESSNNDKPKIDGFFLPEKGIAFVSILTLANPSDDPRENDHKLEEVQTLLKEGINNSLQNKCNAYFNAHYQKCNSTYGNPCLYCGTHHRYSSRYGRDWTQTTEISDVVKTASAYLNKTMFERMCQKVAIEKLFKHQAHYKVIGSLYFLTNKIWVQQELVCQLQTPEGV